MSESQSLSDGVVAAIIVMCAIIAVIIAGLVVMLVRPTLFKCVKINDAPGADVEHGEGDALVQNTDL